MSSLVDLYEKRPESDNRPLRAFLTGRSEAFKRTKNEFSSDLIVLGNGMFPAVLSYTAALAGLSCYWLCPEDYSSESDKSELSRPAIFQILDLYKWRLATKRLNMRAPHLISVKENGFVVNTKRLFHEIVLASRQEGAVVISHSECLAILENSNSFVLKIRDKFSSSIFDFKCGVVFDCREDRKVASVSNANKLWKMAKVPVLQTFESARRAINQILSLSGRSKIEEAVRPLPGGLFLIKAWNDFRSEGLRYAVPEEILAQVFSRLGSRVGYLSEPQDFEVISNLTILGELKLVAQSEDPQSIEELIFGRLGLSGSEEQILGLRERIGRVDW